MRVFPTKTGKKKYGDFVVVDGKMLFNRVGSVNAQAQKHSKAVPVKRGVWAFPYPIFDYFFVGAPCSAPHQAAPESDKIIPIDDKLRKELNKRLKGLKKKMEIGMSKLIPTKDQPRPAYWGDEKYEIQEIEAALVKGEITGSSYSSAFRKSKYKNSNKIRRFYWGGSIYARFAPKGEIPSELGWYLYKDIYTYINELRKQLIYMHKAKYHPKGWMKAAVGIVNERDCNLGTDHLEVFIPMRGD